MNSAGIKDFFRQLPSKLDAEAAEDVDAVYQFELSGAHGGQYVVTIREGACQVNEGRHEDPHVILSMAGEDCVKVLNGELSGPAAAMSGRIRISGDMGLAMQLRALFPSITDQL
jgi:putative sterol carrier protein